MPPFNELELFVLESMGKNSTNESHALKEQVKNSCVESRKNTGAGFFTKINIENNTEKINSPVISGIFCKISGLKNPMSFVLFLKDGYISTLEGASIDESTSGIDYSKVKFALTE